MNPSPTPSARLAAAIIAALALASFLVQPFVPEGGWWTNAAARFRYFTTWANTGALVVMALVALGRRPGRAVLVSLVASLAVVGLVYWGLLAADHHPVGWDAATNQIDHTVVPLAVLGWWFAFAPSAERADRMAPLLPAVVAPPLIYAVFALIYGKSTGFYPYFFSDQPRLGWAMFLLANLGLALLFAMIGAALVAIRYRLRLQS